MRHRARFRLIARCAVGLAAICGAAAYARAADGRHPPPAVQSPVEPEQSLSLFELADPNLRVELAAAEPQVRDPVAVAFDEAGRMWVVEMGDYPNGPAPGQLPLSRVRLLEDRDGDGRFETAYDFRDHLLFATGIQPWMGGVIVTLAGRVAWMKDTDGDGKADLEETWFTGFAEQNPQLRANHPTFAPDNRVYVANGLRGGTVIARKSDWKATARPVSISGRDFAFDPLTGACGAVSGVGQFGTTFDDFGNRFVCSNRNPCQHVVLNDADLARTPWAAIAAVMHDVSLPGDESRVYPLSRAWTTSTLHAGQFTAACGVTVYRGDALGDAYQGNILICEPTGNLVHRDVVDAAGPTFQARKTQRRAEFLASRDEWFRPVNLANGPDGALYVVDMYRAVIEHPEWVPDELKHRPDERAGDDRGRIYRIVPKTFRRQPRVPPAPPIDATSPAGLAAALDSAGGWRRETAARLLYERQDKSVRGPLQRLATAAPHPATRAAALFVLDGIGELHADLLSHAMRDGDARVRACAVRLAARRIPAQPRLRTQLLHMAAAETDHRGRFEIVLALGNILDEAPAAALMARLAIAESPDEWSRKAVAASLSRRGSAVFAEVVRALETKRGGPSPADAILVGELAEVVGAAPHAANPPATPPVETALQSLGSLLNQAVQRPAEANRAAAVLCGFNGLFRGIHRRSAGNPAAPLGKEARRSLIGLAERIAAADGDPARRCAAIDVLRAVADRGPVPPIVLALARGAGDQSVRLAALAALCDFADPSIDAAVLADFQSQTPAVRRAVLDVLLSNARRVPRLLDELEARRISRAELDPPRIGRLLHQADPATRKRAEALLAAAAPADRKKVIAEYQKSLALPADAKRGREVFSKNCTACHRVGELGVNVAPDIGDSRTMTAGQILVDVLDPNRKVDNNFFSYTAITKDGRTFTGILATETATSVTLRQQENKTVSLLRDQIETLHSEGLSLMPAGLEKNIDVQQMADLIAFIKNWRYLEQGGPPAASVRQRGGSPSGEPAP